jgi:hypothetical protein
VLLAMLLIGLILAATVLGAVGMRLDRRHHQAGPIAVSVNRYSGLSMLAKSIGDAPIT